MSFVGKIWKVLVGIKDGLVLVFMLLFFIALFGLLSASPDPGKVREGALYIELDGFVVEERAPLDPFTAILSGEAPVQEFQARDLVRALDAAATDERVKAVVFDLTLFAGGGQVHLQEIGEAIERVRQADKPVLTYALAYADDHLQLASHASEVWVDPMGGALVSGPGGTNLYYADLLEKLSINARIYRVGEFKSAVEPYERNSMSAEARENLESLYGALWEEWQANVKRARPAAEIDRVTSDPVAWVEASAGDLAEAALDAKLVDRLGSRAEFGTRVAELAGEDRWDERPGAFARSDYAPYLADTAPDEPGKAIGVVTIAGTIVDGDAGPGTAGEGRIVDLLDRALDDDLAGLVVRVNSPGGSAIASEKIRIAVQRYRDKGLPVAVSFGNIAASGGYWIATAGDRIFAQPETITGSIGVFAVLPTFEDAAERIGVTADGFRTTPLSGQPDLIAGLTPEVDTILQASVGNSYSDFIELVAKSRGLSVDRVDTIAQGRVWDGGTARQIGLVDQFGGLDDALRWTAAQAELDEGDWHPRFLGEAAPRYDSLIRQIVTEAAAPAPSAAGGDLFAQAARQREGVLARVAGDVERLSGARGVQAYCLACPGEDRPQAARAARGWVETLAQLFAK
ncbi:signal peptide peptidase SppA [Erythrobacter sp. HL-111]|uniref:signal peptide peptidase SppA n=1 Tax=Erythrobacter sp. HL-111 TaxID=1798193 RepID=UPI0006DB67AA|nr:signal peptide peptidase SppA [Erythrobacter sp. HL-111]KPP91224.1 MAG: signal peptide peptidase SppA [Erythrobacteraceae bacterium HL-111]SDT06523.1 signal peptide peptidase A. Serine peptidase. MEROPS family S49 [Erythrobacter sp. HL-111]